MTILQGVLLGLLQGIAEFLPISSSGHLRVAQALFSLDNVPLLFDVALHVATLAAVFIYFRRVIAKLFCVLFRWIFKKAEPSQSYSISNVKRQDERTVALASSDEIGKRTIIALFLTTFVTGVLGIVSSKLIPELPMQAVAIGFLVTAVLLVISAAVSRKRELPESKEIKDDFFDESNKGISWKQALIIGVAQGIGTLPGISRSGSTIAGAGLCGVRRRAAGDYSFLASIPAIFGAFILELRHVGEMGETVGILPLIFGCICAFASGYVSLSLFMKIIRKGRLEWFAAYLIPLGILVFIFL